MASQVVTTDGDLPVVVAVLCEGVRYYHAYMQSWSPVVGQALRIKREPANANDVHAFAV